VTACFVKIAQAPPASTGSAYGFLFSVPPQVQDGRQLESGLVERQVV